MSGPRAKRLRQESERDIRDELERERELLEQMLNEDRGEVADPAFFDRKIAPELRFVTRYGAKAVPDEECFSCTLYEYQKESLAWMLMRERFVNPRRNEGQHRRDMQWRVDDQGTMVNRVTGVRMILPSDPVIKQEADELPPKEKEELDDDDSGLQAMDISEEEAVDAPLALEAADVRASVRGGILADEMGLGKTIQMIALICTHRAPANFAGNPATLVVVPPILMYQWKAELKKCAPQLSVYIYHGTGRNPRMFEGEDVVITTYYTIQADVRVGRAGVYASEWWRIILDEGHIIRNSTTKLSQVTFAINGRNRWVLSGTPIQNKYADLFSLLKFLRARPYGDADGWYNLILKPLEAKSGHYAKYKDEAFLRLRNIVQQLVMRRTKAQEDDNAQLRPRSILSFPGDDRLWKVESMDLEHFTISPLEGERQIFDVPYNAPYQLNRTLVYLPPKTFRQSVVQFMNPKRRKAYDLLQKQALLDIEGQARSISNPLTHILRMQQLAIHPWLVAKDKDRLKKHLDNMHKSRDFSDFISSAKLDFVVGDLDEQLRADPSVKSIVFSRFTQALDVLDITLQRAGWMRERDYQKYKSQLDPNTPRFVRIDGSSTRTQTNEAIAKLTNDEGVKLMLVSLMAAGVGLNLVRASRVYFLEPFFSGAVHAQAIDRVHRIGQTRPVVVTNVVMDGTIESNIMELQRVKDMITSATFRPVNLGIEEVRALIRK